MPELSNRQRLILTALILVSILLYWGVAETPQEASRASAELSDKMDYFIDSAKSREWNESGTLQRQISSVRVEHDPNALLNHLTQPRSMIYRDDSSSVSVTADEGISYDDNSRTDLAGNVIVHDNPSTESGTVLTTEALSIFPQKDLAETDQKVIITSTSGNIEGVGMDYHFEKKVMNLHAKVKGFYKDAK
jgi:lipopolysaccharide export system protein LptC